MWECGLADVFQNSDHAKNGSRIDSIAERFVIEADVAASDGNFKLFANLSYHHAIRMGREQQPHDAQARFRAQGR